MTVTYTAEVATSSGLGCFLKLLFRWKGSIYKLLWPNLLLYSVLYFSLSLYYRFVLSQPEKEWFERLSIHCQTYGNLIPVSFVLGFYVSLVIKRWWDQYISIPWPDNLALFVSALVHGQDDRGRLMRRTVVRYVNLSLVLTLRMVSPRVKMRFPTMDHLVEAGLLQPNEMKIFEDLDKKTNHPKYWMPLVWASGVLTRARKENRITNDFSLKTLIDELNIFRTGCGKLLSYDWISIPLVYTQVVTLAVHMYFLATLMGNQYLDVTKGYEKHQIDLVIPFFTFLEFFFYMGWLKVAESLVNPFGEDDDDFEVMWLIDRNLQMSYVIVDEMHEEHPEMLRDAYWDDVVPAELPYTAATKQFQTEPPQGSTKNVEVPVHMADFVKDAAQLDEGEERGVDGVPAGDASGFGTRLRRCHGSRHGSSASVQSYPDGCPAGSQRRTSVLSVLSRAFHREDSAKDLEASGRSSGASLVSRPGVLPPPPAGSAGQRLYDRLSQASSRTTLVGNDLQEEVFRLSDLSLATQGSAHFPVDVISIPVPFAGPPEGSAGVAENVLLNSTPWPEFVGQPSALVARYIAPAEAAPAPEPPSAPRPSCVGDSARLRPRGADVADLPVSPKKEHLGEIEENLLQKIIAAGSAVQEEEKFLEKSRTSPPPLEDFITILAPTHPGELPGELPARIPSPTLDPDPDLAAVPTPCPSDPNGSRVEDTAVAAGEAEDRGLLLSQTQSSITLTGFPLADVPVGAVAAASSGLRRGRDFAQLEPILEHVEEHEASLPGLAPDPVAYCPSTKPSPPSTPPGRDPDTSPTRLPRVDADVHV